MSASPATKGSIAAVSPEWVIGLGNDVPWRHPGDFRRFKRVTLGSTVIMGRLTWESMHRKALPGRRNLVVTRATESLGAERFPDLVSAMAAAEGDVWFIGGARIYAEAMAFADLLDLTFVPDHVTDPAAVHFPAIDPTLFEAGPLLPHEDEPGLWRRVYRRRLA